MAAASHNLPPEPEVFGYYIQIPEKAEVRRVPVSMLSSSVQQRISRLGGNNKASYVIVVSPIVKQKFPSNHKKRKTSIKAAAKNLQVTSSNTSQLTIRRSSKRIAATRAKEEQKTYLVPVKCFKDIALTILQLSQTYNQEPLNVKSELRALSDSLNVNQQAMIKMEAAALYMSKNVMYLLPEGKKAEIRGEKCKAEVKVKKSEVLDSQIQVVRLTFEETKQKIVPTDSQVKMEKKSRNNEGRHDDLGCVSLRRSSFLQHQNRRSESRATVVTLCDEDWRPSNERPSSTPTKEEQQISFWEQSEGPSKRKLFSIDNEETSRKKIRQSDSEPKSVPVCSPLRPHLSSLEASPLKAHESSPLFPYVNNPDLKESSPTPYLSPALGDYTSPPHLEAKSSPSGSPLQPHLSSSEASSPPVLQESQPLLYASSLNLKVFSSTSSCSSPTPLGQYPIYGDYMTPPHLEAKSSPSGSPLQPHLSLEASSLLDPQELQPLFFDANSLNLQVFSTNSCSSPAPPGQHTTLADYTSLPNVKAKSSPSCSPLQPHLSSSEDCSPLDPQDLPPLCLDGNSLNLKVFSSTSPQSSPAPPEPHPTSEAYTSSPHLETKSCPSDSSSSSEPGDTASLNDTLPILNYLESRRTSLFDDIDDTTKDEKLQKLLADVKEWHKVIDDMRQKE
ncbi:uncharacterized protein ACNLHF_008435 [Anomaloglossus baeobatrachus]|uniref:uncharacterized protein LOC142290768 n=1 Tax=Anomaloglossus baeobatrachus TaxID=238106 RepID=UPI003F508B54